MSILKKSSAATAAARTTSGAELPMLTPEELIEQLRLIQQRIPQFTHLPKALRTERVRRVARLNPEFAREAFSAVGASDVVQTVIGNTADELVEASDLSTRWALAENEMRATLKGLSGANFVRRQEMGEAALQAYNVSRQLATREEHAHLLPYVEQMIRLPRYGRRRTRPSAAEPQPPPPSQPATDPQTKSG